MGAVGAVARRQPDLDPTGGEGGDLSGRVGAEVLPEGEAGDRGSVAEQHDAARGGGGRVGQDLPALGFGREQHASAGDLADIGVGVEGRGGALAVFDRLQDGAALRVVGAACHGVEGFEGGAVELGHDGRLGDDQLAEGQGAGLVEDNLADPKSALEEADPPHEEAVATGPGERQLVGQGGRQAQGARAGHDEDGDADFDRPLGSRRQPDEDRGDGGGQHGDHVEARDPMPERGPGDVVAVAVGRRQESLQAGRLEGAGGLHADRAVDDVPSASRDEGARDEVRWIRFAVDPLQAQRGGRVEQPALDRQDLAGGQHQAVASDDRVGADHAQQTIGADAANHQAVDALVAQQHLAVPAQDTALEEAATEHQGDEEGQRVEVGRAAVAGEEGPDATGVAEDDADGDGNVEVQEPLAGRCERAFDEDGSADRHSGGRQGEVEPGEDRGQVAVLGFGHPEVERQREDHAVHRDRGAQPQPDEQPVDRLVATLQRRPCAVAQATDLRQVGLDVEAGRIEGEVESTDARVHLDP